MIKYHVVAMEYLLQDLRLIYSYYSSCIADYNVPRVIIGLSSDSVINV